MTTNRVLFSILDIVMYDTVCYWINIAYDILVLMTEETITKSATQKQRWSKN